MLPRIPAVSSRPGLDPKATRRGELGSSTRAVNRVRCGAAMDCSGCSYRCRERIKRITTRSSPTPRLSPARTRRHGGRRIPGPPRTVWFCLSRNLSARLRRARGRHGADGKDDQQELVEDLIAITTAFSTRIVGKRGGKKVAATVRQAMATLAQEGVPG